MTVSSDTSRNIYNGNGSTDTFAYTFKIPDDDSILVQWKNIDTGVITTKTKTTHYTVTGAGESVGGNIVFGALSIPDSDTQIILLRNMDFLQETDYQEYDSFPAETHELALDKLTMECQELQEASERTFTLDPAVADSLSFNFTFPDPTDKAGYLIAINTAEDAFEYVIAADSALFTFPSGTGILVKNGDTTSVVRTLTGTSNEITVTNGTGVSANPTISLPTALTFTGKTITGGKYVSSTFADNADNTKQISFTLSGITTATTRAITFQDSAGTVALLGNKLSAFAATTSSELAGVISDETGTGALVFAVAPTLTGVITVNYEDARTNTVVNTLDLRATTSGTPAAGIGAGIVFSAESADENPSQFGALQFAAADVTAGSEDTYHSILLRVAGNALAERYRHTSTSTAGVLNWTHAVTANRTVTWPDQNLSKYYIARASSVTGAFSSGTTQIPTDNTTPTSSEGDQYFSLGYQAAHTTNRLRIEIHIEASNSGSGAYMCVALFLSTTCLATAWEEMVVANTPRKIVLVYEMDAGTTSAQTFNVRVGYGAAGTTSINGAGGSGLYNATGVSGIFITEYSA